MVVAILGHDRRRMALDSALETLDVRPRPDCATCHGSGWVCEEHRESPCPHGCHGPEVPCEEPGCLSDWFRRHGLD
jgi:hypothetical protein